jgi:hypothetical protein
MTSSVIGVLRGPKRVCCEKKKINDTRDLMIDCYRQQNCCDSRKKNPMLRL